MFVARQRETRLSLFFSNTGKGNESVLSFEGGISIDVFSVNPLRDIYQGISREVLRKLVLFSEKISTIHNSIHRK